MPFQRKRPPLRIFEEYRNELCKIKSSRSEPIHRVERAQILLAYADGVSVSAIARTFQTNRPKVERCIDKALQLGVLASLRDLPRSGKPVVITPEARTWVIDQACIFPKQLGYSYELWTSRLLAKHLRKKCREAGHPCLEHIACGTVSKILSAHPIHPHKIQYYLERRDLEFEKKMAQVLYVYKQVELLQKSGGEEQEMEVILSYDEKPGIQAIGTTAPDLPPVPGKQPCIGRDHEYIRYGTVSLMAGINLLNGKIHGLVVERHRSREFIQFLQCVDEQYPAGLSIRIVLDNPTIHISKETRRYLASVPNRFEFIFTPKHGSWLNLIESFFAKMTRSMLRGIRVSSKAQLKERILQYLDEINAEPVIFHWKYQLDTISLT